MVSTNRNRNSGFGDILFIWVLGPLGYVLCRLLLPVGCVMCEWAALAFSDQLFSTLARASALSG